MEPNYPFETPGKMRLPILNRFFAYLNALPPSDSLLLKIALIVFVVFLFWSLIVISTHSQIDRASTGGSLTEGIVGTPRFVNPVLAVTRADKDLAYLTYDGLLSLGKDGALEPNIAESVTASDDGLTYNVLLRKDVYFHDHTPLTALDVVFTVGRIQETSLASPLRVNFEGVTVEQVGDYELNFILPEPYAPFIENLTFGILPQHLWKDASNEEFPFSQRNSEPIGTGPYMVDKIVRNDSGIPEAYILKPNPVYHRGRPKIESITARFFGSDEKLIEAFNAGEIESIAGIDQSKLSALKINPATHTIVRIPLPRTFALFINQNKSPALRDKGARTALDTAINRTSLIESVLGGYGRALYSPVPEGFGVKTPTSTPQTEGTTFDAARAILKDAGWKLNSETDIWEKQIDGTLTPLSFSISTVNNPVFEATAEFIQSTWEKLGAKVTIKQFEQSDLTQSIIRPRDYETLLFGAHVGRSLDFYSFWHSSQRNDPGLNVSLYANITTDSILSKVRTNRNDDERKASLEQFQEEIKKETPAIFFYQPELLYIFPTKVKDATFTGVGELQERFATLGSWYINTESIWPLFKNYFN